MISADDKIADVLAKYPQIKPKLFERNSMFKNLDNPVVFNTVGRFAKIRDIAKNSGENLDEFLAWLNSNIR